MSSLPVFWYSVFSTRTHTSEVNITHSIAVLRDQWRTDGSVL